MSERSDLEPQSSVEAGRTERAIKGTVICVLLCISVIMNIGLARRVSTLKAAIEQVKSEGRLQIGANVPAVEGRPVGGLQGRLSYSEVNIPTVLYVFTPQCGWCKKNLDNLRALIDESGPRYRVVGLSLSSQDLGEYLEKEHLRMPVYTDISEDTKRIYKLGGTPATIVVSPESTVLRVWVGAYTNDNRQEIEQYLSIRLPGCCKVDVADSTH